MQETVELGPGYLDKPSVTLRLGKKEVGAVGTIDPRVLSGFEIEGMTVAYAELDLERITGISPTTPRVQPLPKVSPVVRDIAVLLPEDVPYREVRQVIEEAGRPLLAQIALFDLYRGKQVPSGKKSMAFRLSFSAGDRTLTESEVGSTHQKIVEQLANRFQASLR